MLERISGIRAGYVTTLLRAESIGLRLILLVALSKKVYADGISYWYLEFGRRQLQSVSANNRGIGFDGSYDRSVLRSRRLAPAAKHADAKPQNAPQCSAAPLHQFTSRLDIETQSIYDSSA